MPPRPNSPRISYLPTLVAVSMLLPRTDAKRLTMHVLADFCGGQCSVGEVFRNCHEVRVSRVWRGSEGKGGCRMTDSGRRSEGGDDTGEITARGLGGPKSGGAWDRCEGRRNHEGQRIYTAGGHWDGRGR